MTFLEAFRLMNAEQFERYGRGFFNSRNEEKALKDLNSPLPDWLEEAVKKTFNQPLSSDGKQ
ncbi:hypothetical protein [Peptoniphilus indolicus]|uniref:Uncharacterized protein n=2 Tax=Peptoniphilus indolicus TaxID=33030 RepID=G4D5K0_9FIRM|nr:hypothetical protein [Peptoniphilus indolicus]EGY78666.1 hypothetical protein HMPREF9129_1680 [Peptoniphilus indolicus ATCC 29427]SUB74419.1 Uncharacterised protein [Peptoniphilus indolicus]